MAVLCPALKIVELEVVVDRRDAAAVCLFLSRCPSVHLLLPCASRVGPQREEHPTYHYYIRRRSRRAPSDALQTRSHHHFERAPVCGNGRV